MSSPKDRPQVRCPWPSEDPLMIEYHDTEWGVPAHDDLRLFEYLILDANQAGLSWKTILHKRENFRRAYAGFDPAKIARFGDRDRARLLADAGIIRNRQKIDAAIVNAKLFLKTQEEFGSFDKYIWRFTDGATKHNRWAGVKEVPAKTAESDAMSKDLRARGYKFVGSTICYAFMQAAGMVNDHLVDCFRHLAVGSAARNPSRSRS